MKQNRYLTAVFFPMARLIHHLRYKRPFTTPKKAIILQPGTVGDVMLTTPMLALLKHTFPKTRFDWAGLEGAYLTLSGNEDIVHYLTIPTTPKLKKIDDKALVRRLQEGQYDTCFIPDYYPQMARIAIQAQIPQRIGLWNGGRGYSFTNPIQAQIAERHQAANNLALAELSSNSIQLSKGAMEFYPSDSDRKAVSERLIDELDWMGDRPLVLMNPGSGDEDDSRRWPIERYVLLGNRILRNHKAQLLLVGEASDRKITHEVAGMIAGQVGNWAGRISLGQIGALAEVADLYIGNDCGSTHIAAAIGCATVAIFGPSDPSESAPYHPNDEKIVVLWKRSEEKRPFSWEDGVTLAEAETAVRKLMPK